MKVAVRDQTLRMAYKLGNTVQHTLQFALAIRNYKYRYWNNFDACLALLVFAKKTKCVQTFDQTPSYFPGKHNPNDSEKEGSGLSTFNQFSFKAHHEAQRFAARVDGKIQQIISEQLSAPLADHWRDQQVYEHYSEVTIYRGYDECGVNVVFCCCLFESML